MNAAKVETCAPASHRAATDQRDEEGRVKERNNWNERGRVALTGREVQTPAAQDVVLHVVRICTVPCATQRSNQIESVISTPSKERCIAGATLQDRFASTATFPSLLPPHSSFWSLFLGHGTNHPSSGMERMRKRASER